MKIVDIKGKEFKVGDHVNVFFTSGDGEYMSDCVYEVVLGVLGGLEFRHVDLLWESYGHNQCTLNTCLNEKYGTLDYRCGGDGTFHLVIPNKWEENSLYKARWKANYCSAYFEILGR